MTHKWENNYNCRGYPQGVRGPSPTSGSPAWEDKPLEHLTLKVMGLTLGRDRGLWEIGIPTQNLTGFRSQGRSNNLKGVRVRPTCVILESLPKRQEAIGIHSWGHRHWQQVFLGAHSTSSLFPSGPSPAHILQTKGTSTGMPQIKKLTGHGHRPIH